MKASELRIGNWVEYNMPYPTPHWQVIEINYINGDYVESDHRGIPLTEDWLVKLGFDKVVDGNGIMELSIQQFDLRWTKDHGFRLGDMSDHCYEEWNFNHIKYIHQLQNVFFALTGEELTYTP